VLLVLRYPALFLLGVFFTLGPAPFEQFHLAAANRSWQFPQPNGQSTPFSPLKRLPVRHDRSKCQLCALLNAAITVQQAALPSLAPMSCLGCQLIDFCQQFRFVFASCQHCRGPPTV